MPLVSKSFSDIITFSRGSNATYFDSAGVLKYAPNNAIRNNTMVGAAAGTPGTLPTNWTAQNVGGVALTEVVGTGTEDGIPYVDVRYTGTTSSTANGGIIAEQGNVISALPGQMWSSSFFLRIVGGSTANISDIANSIQERDSVGSLLAATNTSVSPTGAPLSTQRFSTTRTLSNASTAFVNPRITITPVSGAAIDITLRIGLPQLEIGNTAGPAIPTSGTAYYGPRLDYDPATLAARGLLIEEQRTNSITNNTMQGAVAGTPGTPPTNWNIVSSASGLTREIVGTGTENGIAYVDIRWSGTSTSAGSTRTTATTTTEVAALTSQTWTISKYLKLAGGNFPGALSIVWQERDSGGTPVMTVSTTIGTPTAAALNTQRYFDTKTLSGGASVAYVTARVDVDIPNATVVDFTLRIGLPQLEQGAFATSVIPTTTTALTRSADVASVNTLSPWFNATEGTLFGEFSSYASGARAIVGISDGTLNNRIQFFANAGDPYTIASRLVSGGTQTNPANTGSIAVGAIGKAALAYAVGTNQGATSVNGGAPTTSSPAAIAVGVNTLELGKGSALATMSGHIRRVTYYPRRLSNAELQAITS